MARIALISCTSLKENYRCPAKELYFKSPTFRLAYAFAEIVADHTYILSAKYGLVSIDDILAPYNETLLDKTDEQKKNGAMKLYLSLRAKCLLVMMNLLFLQVITIANIYCCLSPNIGSLWKGNAKVKGNQLFIT